MKNKILIGSLAMDLKRVALAYFQKSNKTGDVFSREALNRINEIDKQVVSGYIAKHLENLPLKLAENDKSKVAENALMYSTIFQNYTLRKRFFKAV